MHGLINRSIQCFIQDTYGQRSWDDVVRAAGLQVRGFEAMLAYDDALTDRMIEAATRLLGRSREHLLEDLGHYLVSHDSLTSVRRLLRFSGLNFIDFVNSLEELPERGRLALPDLDLPELELLDHGAGQFMLKCTAPLKGAGNILVGLLRAMADDYGALVTLENLGDEEGAEIISILIADQALYEARPFHLGAEVA
jgi:hypothetical protein